eukprot:CAMPEP_0115121756 /NCGR_PEP_ID=MMETSP0227-20121206/46426_1 /TAXON_ID=89957 /ORGANISM="Polarella glacialis, Strain CCMP 1383" /LENGTH=548 /DNA_ID=CAMNT_0002523577 /DNA_START=174 /DNA_END=1820 /DNA_ORIENTATION=+
MGDPQNTGMVNELVESGSLKSSRCIAAFKAIDRGYFWPSEGRDLAYAVMPLRHGKLHLSAPDIYGKALESLMPLQPGMSFLNIGSGTGYFNSLVSELIGPQSANHGIDIWPECLAHARERCSRLGKRHLQFTLGNVYQLNVNDTMRYDRIYVGACANSRSKYLYRLLEVGGILVGPFQAGRCQQLRRVVRQSEMQFFVEILASVQFACLVEPPPAAVHFAPPPTISSAALQQEEASASGSTSPADSSSSENSDGVPEDISLKPLGLPGVPFTFALLETPWTPERSWLYPASFKRAAAAGVVGRPRDPGLPALPADIWVKHVIPRCSRRWFEAPSPSPLRSIDAQMLASPSAKGKAGSDSEDSSEDGVSTRASSAQTAPASGPSQDPHAVAGSMPDIGFGSSASHNFKADVLFEVWGNGLRHAIGAEGDPDDYDSEPAPRMAMPLRVMQLLAEEARSRHQRRRREEDEDMEGAEEVTPATRVAAVWDEEEEEEWEEDDEDWEDGDESFDEDMAQSWGRPWPNREMELPMPAAPRERDQDMRDVEDVPML